MLSTPANKGKSRDFDTKRKNLKDQLRDIVFKHSQTDSSYSGEEGFIHLNGIKVITGPSVRNQI